MTAERIVVAMSGGVDSSLAAALLLEDGYETIGVSMRLGFEEGAAEGSCCGLDGADSARRVADRLGIPFYVLDYRQEFEREVVDVFCEEYGCGRTPNPCILCNDRLKFGSLLDMAGKLGARRVATGHYARVERDGEAGRWLLKRGRDREKDQSYVLFCLDQGQLSRAVFPLGGYGKQDVRAEARRRGIRAHDRPDSQDICFIPDGRLREFLAARTPRALRARECRSGVIRSAGGEVLGEHPGVEFFTVGQRRGLGLAGGTPLYVAAIDAGRNELVVGSDEDTHRRVIGAGDVNFIPFERLEGPMRVTARIRYRHREAPAVIRPVGGGRVEVEFDSPQRAPAPGQAVVFYEGEMVVGGGWIGPAAEGVHGAQDAARLAGRGAPGTESERRRRDTALYPC